MAASSFSDQTFSNSKNGLKALSEIISNITLLSLPAVGWLESAGAMDKQALDW
jgi:hypothetical protein